MTAIMRCLRTNRHIDATLVEFESGIQITRASAEVIS